MAFTSATTAVTVMGNKRVAYGTFDQEDTDTGGDITTGFSDVDFFEATGATDVSITSGVATIVTADPGADQSGFWMAIGG